MRHSRRPNDTNSGRIVLIGGSELPRGRSIYQAKYLSFNAYRCTTAQLCYVASVVRHSRRLPLQYASTDTLCLVFDLKPCVCSPFTRPLSACYLPPAISAWSHEERETMVLSTDCHPPRINTKITPRPRLSRHTRSNLQLLSWRRIPQTT